MEKSKIVQARNPKTKKFIKIDRVKGKIISVSKTDKPFADIPIIRKKKAAKSKPAKRVKRVTKKKK